MRSTYQALDAIVALLREAQTVGNTLDFSIRSSTTIYDFQPGDFTVDGQHTQDGVYVYFDNTKFDVNQADNDTQTHYPVINFDMYTSVPATKSESTGAITFGVLLADRAIRSMAIEVYEALSHATFRRKLEETLSPGNQWTPSDVHVSSCVKIGVLRIPQSSKAIAAQRMTLTVNTCENHGMVTGIDLDGIDDRLLPTRSADVD